MSTETGEEREKERGRERERETGRVCVFVDEMTRLRGHVAERGVDMATEQKLSMFQQQWMTEMQSLQSQLVSMHSRLDEVSSKSSVTSTALLEQYVFPCVLLPAVQFS